MFFRNYKRRKKCLCKSLKSHNSVRLMIVNILKGPKHKYDKYCLDNKQILKKPIQMQLSKKLSIFPPLFKEFLKSTLNFDHFEKKMSLVGYVFPKL